MTMKPIINEEKLVKHLMPKIEKIVYKTVKAMLPPEVFYPPESMIKKSFIKRVLEAEKRIEKGEGKKFNNIREFKKYLNSLKDE